MLFVKMIANYSMVDFENEINNWLSENSDVAVISIAYNNTVDNDGRMLFNCMIFYSRSGL